MTTTTDDREQEQESPVQGVKRGDFLKLAGLVGLASALAEPLLRHPEKALAAGAKAAPATAQTSTSTFTPVRPPATPLAVRSAYLNTWQFADNLAGTWPTFWNGDIKAIAGIVRVDDVAYEFMGIPNNSLTTALPVVTQTALEVTATQSRYTLQAGPVTLLVTFLSPVEATDLRRLSMPVSYILVQAKSNDGATHRVSVYVDISGEWAHSNPTTPVTWQQEQAGTGSPASTILSITPAAPAILTEYNDYPQWARALLATLNGSNVSYQIAQDSVARQAGAAQGSLANSVDPVMPRPINAAYPVLAFKSDLGQVGTRPSDPFTLVLGLVRTPAVSYISNLLESYWTKFWPSFNYQDMIAFALGDAVDALSRATVLDAKVKLDAISAVGSSTEYTAGGTLTEGGEYAALCALALRQTFGGAEMVLSPSNTPWYFVKEISSSGNVSTVDVIYPSFPAFLYTSPALIRLLIDPIIDICENPTAPNHWNQPFAIHDIGSLYPNATGHPNAAGHDAEEDMPVEETANMLIMVAAYMQRVGQDDARAYATAHYPLFKQWAEYLTADNGGGTGRSNALDPENQNQTDDFSGFISHSTNLALKGIIGVAAMGNIIAPLAGHTDDAQHYSSTAQDYIRQWATMAQDPSGKHLMLTYTETNQQGTTGPTDGTGTWSLKYNAYPDKVLGTNLVPDSVLQEEATWYETQKEAYGIPLDSRHTAGSTSGVYTKADWELWTAAATNDPQLRADIIHLLYKFVNETSTRVPFTDLYDTQAGTQYAVPYSPAGHFQARAVIGALFALSTLNSPVGSGGGSPTATPEPGSGLLYATGLAAVVAALAAWGRRASQA